MEYFDAQLAGGSISLLLIALYAVTSISVATLLDTLVTRVWRAGLDAQRDLGGIVVGTKLFLTLGFGALLAARAVQEFALGHVFQSVITLLVFVLGAVSVGHDVVGCFVLTFSTKVRIGDRMQLDGQSGTVRKIGLLQTTLRDASGTKLVIPNRDFLVKPLAIAKTKHSVPLRLTFPVPDRARQTQLLQRVRALALLCPFRSANSTVLVDWSTTELEVQLEVWSPTALTHAEEQLNVAIRSVLEEEIGGRPS